MSCRAFLNSCFEKDAWFVADPTGAGHFMGLYLGDGVTQTSPGYITRTHLQAREVCRRCSNTACITTILGFPWLLGCHCFDTVRLCEARHKPGVKCDRLPKVTILFRDNC